MLGEGHLVLMLSKLVIQGYSPENNNNRLFNHDNVMLSVRGIKRILIIKQIVQFKTYVGCIFKASNSGKNK